MEKINKIWFMLAIVFMSPTFSYSMETSFKQEMDKLEKRKKELMKELEEMELLKISSFLIKYMENYSFPDYVKLLSEESKDEFAGPIIEAYYDNEKFYLIKSIKTENFYYFFRTHLDEEVVYSTGLELLNLKNIDNVGYPLYNIRKIVKAMYNAINKYEKKTKDYVYLEVDPRTLDLISFKRKKLYKPLQEAQKEKKYVDVEFITTK